MAHGCFASCRIQQRLQLVHGVAKLVCAAEFADDLGHVAVLGDRGDFQHVGQCKLEFAVRGVFLQQVIQDFAGFGGEVVEEAVCCFFTRSARWRRVSTGALKARWHNRSNGSASGLPACKATCWKSIPRSARWWMMSAR